MQAADEQERTHTEGRNYCAYNRTQGSFLSLRIAAIESPSGSGQIKLQSLANNSQSGLWITPFSELPDGFAQLVFDLVYLDQDCRVIGVESFPNPQPATPAAPIASALALAPRTITSTLTQPNDEIIIWSLSEAEPQPQRGLRASLRGRSRSNGATDTARASSNGSSATSAAKEQEPAASHATSPDSGEDESREQPSFFKRLFGGRASSRNASAPISLFAAQPAPAAPAAPPAQVTVPAATPSPTPVEAPVPPSTVAPVESFTPPHADALPEPLVTPVPVETAPEPASILSAPEPEPLPAEPVAAVPVAAVPVVAEQAAAEPVVNGQILSEPVQDPASIAAIPAPEEPVFEESPAASVQQPAAEALPQEIPAETAPLPSATTQPAATRRIVAIPGPNGTAYVVQNADESLPSKALAPVAEAAAPIPAPVAELPEPPLPAAAEAPAASLAAHQTAETPQSKPEPAISAPVEPPAPAAASVPQQTAAPAATPEPAPAAPAPHHQKRDRQRQSQATRKAEKKARARQRATKSESDRRDGARRRFTFQRSPSEEAASGPSLKTRFVRWLTAPPQAAKRMRAPQIVAYFWTGGAPQPHTVANISVTGLYIYTKDRWMPDTVIVMNLQWTDCDGSHPGDTISVLSKVVRSGEDGVGFQFVTSDAVNAIDGQYLPGKGSDRAALDRFLWRRKRLAANMSA